MIHHKGMLNTFSGGCSAEEILAGRHHVLTHNRRWRMIVDIRHSYELVWEIKSSCRQHNLFVTSNQIILTNKGWMQVMDLNVEKHSIAMSQEISFVNFPEQPQEIDDRFGSAGLFYCPVKFVNETPIRANVLDFIVENDRSYSCDGIVLKCQ